MGNTMFAGFFLGKIIDDIRNSPVMDLALRGSALLCLTKKRKPPQRELRGAFYWNRD
jgi:hypothetical protein